VRGVVISNPDNPLGRTYSYEDISGLIEFCTRNDLHLISDEVYANTVFDAPEFISAAKVALDKSASDRVHTVWAFSKDFCLSGFRVGVTQSRNADVIEYASALSRFTSVPTEVQRLMLSILQDKSFVSEFVTSHKSRLRNAYRATTKALDSIGLPFASANCGLFVWAKFASTADEERAAFKRLCENGVYVMPGSMFRTEEKGWFRLVYAHNEKDLKVGLDRLTSTHFYLNR